MVLLWAVRLFLFLLYREFVNWPQWHTSIKEADARQTMSAKVSIWITCSLFYSALFLPCLSRLQQSLDKANNPFLWGSTGKFGLILQAIGIGLETIADDQKATFKAKEGNRSKWCNVGLWRYSTHPNYLGESIFWLGTYLGGCSSTIQRKVFCFEAIFSLVGLVGILTVMKGANHSLSNKQLKIYGSDNEFIRHRENYGFFGPRLATSIKKQAKVV